jgi:hypothetical protein
MKGSLHTDELMHNGPYGGMLQRGLFVSASERRRIRRDDRE